ncbi:uncharacterized protein LOC131605001 [Vicia villosa]|uniref:uncharacterized protein LOC131605001 n=1 Tax=Vicia villosa TaxID=3911 RepID=UPI00273CF1CF|nr:uncharacterized protein LOC131605001 [Vicia villosa]
MRRLAGIQNALHQGRFHHGMQSLEKELQKYLSLILHQEELMWFQRSRAKWLTDGDRNTKYFHIKAVKRRRKNKISRIKDENGNWIEDSNQIKSLSTYYFQKLFTTNTNTCDWFQTEISYPYIDIYSLYILDQEVSNVDIKEDLFDMSPRKAPGPDDIRFLAKSLSIALKSALTKSSRLSKPDLFQGGTSRRMSLLLMRCYIPCITFNGRTGAFVIKVDLAKAYDNLNWNFVDNVLSEVNLPKKLRRIIMESISSSNMKVS